MHDPKNAYMHMWSEDVAKRGFNEVLSSLNTYLTSVKPSADNLIAWSDSCGGQNNNKNVVSYWYYVLYVMKLFESVEHKFPLPGHSFMPCDRDFGNTVNLG